MQIKKILDHPFSWFLYALIGTVLLGIISYYSFWHNCQGHPCETFTYSQGDSVKCALIMWGKDNNSPCYPGCLNNIDSYPVGTRINTTCYVMNGDYDGHIWFCNIEETLKLPFLPPFCSINIFIWGFIWFIPFGIWFAIILIFIIKQTICIKNIYSQYKLLNILE